jgi:hypothetical protein
LCTEIQALTDGLDEVFRVDMRSHVPEVLRRCRRIDEREEVGADVVVTANLEEPIKSLFRSREGSEVDISA